MLDGGTFRLYFACLNILLHDKKFKFKKSEEDCYSCIYRGLYLKLIYSSGCCVVHGSIHKFKNHGRTNKDLFTIGQLIATLKELYVELYMEKCLKIEFSSIEFNVDIELSYNPQIFIDNILKIKGWKLMTGGIEFESLENYSFKIYAETIKRNIPIRADSVKCKTKHILRFEIKIHKTQKLNQIMSASYFPNISKFSDLIDIDVIRILGNYILEEYGKLMIWDKELIDESLFKGKDKLLFKNGCNIEYWDNYESLPINEGKKSDTISKQKNRELKKFNALLDDNSTIKNEICTLIKNSLKNIFDVAAKDIQDFKLWISQRPDIYFRKEDERSKKNKEMSGSSTLDEPKKKRKPPIEIPIQTKVIRKDIFGNEFLTSEKEIIKIEDSAKMSALYASDKGAESDKNRYCPITKLKKFLNYPRSRFITIKEIEYYYHNCRGMYYRELYPKLSPQWHSAPLDIQFEKIAHAIRNAESNPRNNKKNRLDKKNNPGQFSLDF